MKTRYLLISGLLIVLGFLWRDRTMRSQLPAGDRVERYRKMSVDAETQGLAEPFKGMTTGGGVVPGLFPIRSTGVSTEPVRKAADAFPSVAECRFAGEDRVSRGRFGMAQVDEPALLSAAGRQLQGDE